MPTLLCSLAYDLAHVRCLPNHHQREAEAAVEQKRAEEERQRRAEIEAEQQRLRIIEEEKLRWDAAARAI